jgi:tRNA (guanine-N7-)-methyltransferase
VFDLGVGLAYVGRVAAGIESSARDRALAIAKLYREQAPRAPEGDCDLFELFPRNAEIELEIGFGRGLFLLQRAQAAPGAYLLGLEIKHKHVYLVERRLRALARDRVRVLACDARQLLPVLRPDGALARAFLHFPDPWWKKRHAKRRVLGPEVLDQLARLLRPGGELFVQTDVEERALQCVAQLAEHGAFELPGGGLVDHNPYGAVSNRERRAIEDGLPIHRVLALRRER